jgi:hypothetical protein
MQTIDKDYSAFLAKLTTARYERKGDPDMGEVIDKMAEGIETFKQTQGDTVAELRKTVDRLETRLSRPGAIHTQQDSENELKSLTTADGRKLPLLSAKQRVSNLNRTDDSEGFSLGGFVRDAIVGSRKAASGPALVPTFVSGNVIDNVRAQTVLIGGAGASTIIIDGPTNMARITQDPTVFQHTEGADDITESDILATPVSLNPKLLAALVPLTVELVQDSPNLDAALNASLAGAFAVKLDQLGIAKLLADAGIPKSLATQDPALWAKLLEAVGAALGLNQALPTAHISAPADMIARAGQLASTSGTWLGAPPLLSAMRELHSTGLTAGTALFGDFAAGCAVAMRQELRVEVVRHAKPTSASHLLVAHMRADFVVLQPGRLFKQLKTVA